MHSAIKYFLGSNTNEGFCSFFDELYNPEEDWRVYVIKGGPGCGKSTLMGKLADEMMSRGEKCEKVMCSSDPKSHDAVIFRDRKIAMVDGTAPHIIEPKYYGAVEEIVNLGDTPDKEKLRACADEIRKLTQENACCYKKATNYLKAAASLTRNSKRLQDEYIDYEKLYNYVVRFAKRELHGCEKDGKVSYRFLTAITNEGEVTFEECINGQYHQIINIEDPIGGVSGQLLDCLMTVAMDCGINAIAGVSPFDTDELLQILFPDCGLALITQTPSITPTRTVHVSRFINTDGLKSHKYRIAFNRKAAKELKSVAISCLSEAKGIHDQIEKIYVDAANFDKVNAMSDRTIQSILEKL